MGLKRLVLTATLTVVAALVFAPGAFAWTFSTVGSATCDRSTGQHVVTWSIDNRTEPETLTIRESNRAAVPVGSTAAARSVAHFTERLGGSSTGTITLTVKGNWPSDKSWRTRSASVTLSATCLADVCPNLTGVQEQIPTGLIKDSAGNCVPPPTDVCPNIEGVQQSVPSGMVKDSSGDCVAPPADQCPNLEGVQEHVPAGMAKDTEGGCFTPPEDVCPNIDGVQAVLPEGFTKDESGNCAAAPRFITITEEKTIETTVFVPVERLVSISSAPVTVERIVDRVVTKVVVKRVKVAAKKVKKKKKKARKLKRRVLPFTPYAR